MSVKETWDKGFPHHPQEFEDWGAEVSDKSDDTEAHKASTQNVHGIPDTANLETQVGAQAKANIARDEAIAVADQGSTALDAHINTTTDVHGIPDTALLETQVGAQEKANIARDEAIQVADQGSTALDEHIGTATNVHGIANTADLETQAGAQQKVDTGLNSINISAGTTTTGAPGTDASVTKVGSGPDPSFNFVIPRGDQGEQGIQGDQGIQGPIGPPGVEQGPTPPEDTSILWVNTEDDTSITDVPDPSGEPNARVLAVKSGKLEYAVDGDLIVGRKRLVGYDDFLQGQLGAVTGRVSTSGHTWRLDYGLEPSVLEGGTGNRVSVSNGGAGEVSVATMGDFSDFSVGGAFVVQARIWQTTFTRPAAVVLGVDENYAVQYDVRSDQLHLIDLSDGTTTLISAGGNAANDASLSRVVQMSVSPFRGWLYVTSDIHGHSRLSVPNDGIVHEVLGSGRVGIGGNRTMIYGISVWEAI